MPVSTDPLMIFLTALVLWAFYIACRISDRRRESRLESPRRDTMPSLEPGTEEARL